MIDDDFLLNTCPVCLIPYPPSFTCKNCGRTMDSWFVDDTQPVYAGTLGLKFDWFDEKRMRAVKMHDHLYYWASLFPKPIAKKIRKLADTWLENALEKMASEAYFDKDRPADKSRQRGEQIKEVVSKVGYTLFRWARDLGIVPDGGKKP